MDDLISREAAIEAIKAYCNGCDNYNGVRCRACNFDDAMIAVDSVSAVDAEPVRHGRWVFDKNANDWGIGGYVCSECRAKNNNLPCTEVAAPLMFVGTKYCPNCGAKMEDKDNE